MSRNAAWRDAHNPKLADLVGTIESVPVSAAIAQHSRNVARKTPRDDCRVAASQPCVADVPRS